MAAGNPSNALKKINLTHIAHVYYKHKDIDKARTFLDDFGFTEVQRDGARTYYRGYGSEPFVVCVEAASDNVFGGACFHVESEEDLVHAAKTLPREAKPTDVYELSNAPGGGKGVTFYDPVDGFPFHLVYGQEKVEVQDPRIPKAPVNYVSSPHPDPRCRSARVDVDPPAPREEPRRQHVCEVREAPRAGTQARPLWDVRDRLCQVVRLLHHVLQLLPQRGKRPHALDRGSR